VLSVVARSHGVEASKDAGSFDSALARDAQDERFVRSPLTRPASRKGRGARGPFVLSVVARSHGVEASRDAGSFDSALARDAQDER